MPEGRIILKSISQSKKLASLKTDAARLLYTWLIPHLDVNGCFYGDAVTINALIFTRLNKKPEKIEEYLKDLEANGLIIRYEVNGDLFLTVPDFRQKQPRLNPDREAKPTIPPYKPEWKNTNQDQLLTNSGVTPDQLQSNSNTSKVKVSKVNNRVSKDTLVDLSSTPEPQKKPDKKKTQEKITEILNLWNEFAAKVGLPQVRDITPGSTRERHLRARLNEKGFDFRKILEKVSQSEFLLGLKSDWKVSFDWLIKPSNYVKVLEGNYDSNPASRNTERASRVGENKTRIEFPPGYWEKVRELKEKGFSGQALNEELMKIPEFRAFYQGRLGGVK